MIFSTNTIACYFPCSLRQPLQLDRLLSNWTICLLLSGNALIIWFNFNPLNSANEHLSIWLHSFDRRFKFRHYNYSLNLFIFFRTATINITILKNLVKHFLLNDLLLSMPFLIIHLSYFFCALITRH